jgi:hypothetical protein
VAPASGEVGVCDLAYRQERHSVIIRLQIECFRGCSPFNWMGLEAVSMR